MYIRAYTHFFIYYKIRSKRNSGVLGGKYLERGRVKLPGQEIFKSEFTKYYSASDFYVSAKPVFNDITFIIVGADEYGTFKN